MPTEIIFGENTFSEVSDLIDKAKVSKMLVFIGGKSVRESKLDKILIDRLDSKKIGVDVYEGIKKSDIDTLTKAVAYTRKHNPEAIVAVGGGAVLDVAKVCAALNVNKGPALSYVAGDRKMVNKPNFLVAVPTTSGTGSEVSPFAVIWDSKLKKKYSLESKNLYPSVAVVDPVLTLTLPAYQTACTGMDALTQAIEAYWAKAHNPVSDTFALEAINLALNNLENAVKEGKDLEARINMSKASLLAGLAFSNTRTTICHAISYPLTAHFKITHGHAVSLTLASFLKYSYSSIPLKRRGVLLKALDAGSLNQGIDKINALMKKIGLTTRLGELGINRKDIDLIVKEGFAPERANNAPRIPTKDELKSVLISIY